jgi:predicted Fe-S protein YdhL (DUF1289 family)
MSDVYDDFESPCVRTCVIDQRSGYCHGCARTLHEISYWTRYTIEERRHILQQLSARQIVTPKAPST